MYAQTTDNLIFRDARSFNVSDGATESTGGGARQIVVGCFRSSSQEEAKVANELQVWALDEGGEVTPVERQRNADSEQKLEDTLVKNPEMLMPNLTLVGRQTPTQGGGRLDLLGVDEKGQLVVFELKRGPLTREAVTQVIDYASSLESMSDEDLFVHIADILKTDLQESGIERVENFGEWYTQRFSDEASLRPVHMTLVGLGVDDDAIRMVEFLAKYGLPMSLMTFHGYSHGGRSYLAKQVQTERDVEERAKAKSTDRRERDAKRKKAQVERLEERISASGIQDFWSKVVSTFEEGCKNTTVVEDGFNFEQRYLKLPGQAKGFFAPLSVRLAREGKKVRIIFFPVSIHLCRQAFDDAKCDIGFEEGPRGNAPRTDRIEKQWFCDLNEKDWETHRQKLVTLADAVAEAWRAARREWQSMKRRSGG